MKFTQKGAETVAQQTNAIPFTTSSAPRGSYLAVWEWTSRPRTPLSVKTLPSNKNNFKNPEKYISPQCMLFDKYVNIFWVYENIIPLKVVKGYKLNE